MAVTNNTRSGRRTALALAAAALVLPGIAAAQPDNDSKGGWGKRGDSVESDNGRQGRGGWGARNDDARSGGGGQTPAWGARNDESRGNGGQAPAWGRGGNSDDGGQARGWSGRSGGSWQPRPQPQSAPVATPAPAPAPQAPRWAQPSTWGGSRDNDRRDDRRGSWSGGDTRRDGDRDGRSSRDGSRDGRDWRGTNREGSWSRDNDSWRRDNQTRYNDQWRNQQYRNGSSWSNNNHHSWDRRWRDNNRYDWYRYRSHNPSIFRFGTYYSPYRNYSYRRLSIGFYLDSLFYGSRYWINDPWQYRLPDVYGPYRWVRYYDDALLVNVYDGEVVDVIYDFFW